MKGDPTIPGNSSNLADLIERIKNIYHYDLLYISLRKYNFQGLPHFSVVHQPQSLISQLELEEPLNH
jgi:hypothetical protein